MLERELVEGLHPEPVLFDDAPAIVGISLHSEDHEFPQAVRQIHSPVRSTDVDNTGRRKWTRDISRDRLETDLSPSETDQETSSLITADSLVPKLVREFTHLKDLMIRVGLREP